MTFINNFALLHSRDAFKDSATEQRYLIRVWLKNEKLAWKLPWSLMDSNKVVFYDRSEGEKWNVRQAPRVKLTERMWPS